MNSTGAKSSVATNSAAMPPVGNIRSAPTTMATDANSWPMFVPTSVVATNSEQTYLRMLHLGDRITTRQVLRSVSDEKTTKLGTGRFWVIDVEYHTQDGTWVGTESYTGFGYRR